MTPFLVPNNAHEAWRGMYFRVTVEDDGLPLLVDVKVRRRVDAFLLARRCRLAYGRPARIHACEAFGGVSRSTCIHEDATP